MKHSALPLKPSRSLSGIGVSLLALLAITGCGSSTQSAFEGPLGTPGAIVAAPGAGLPGAAESSKQFIVDPSQGGFSQSIRMTGLFYGRLVDVFGLNSAGQRFPVVQQRDYVIRGDIDDDGQSYVLETNPVTNQSSLTILRDVTDDVIPIGQTKSPQDEFFELMRDAGEGLTPIFDLGLTGSLFSMVPRNAAIVARFDDLLDEDTVNRETVGLFTGNPPTSPFESRVFIDPNHGDLATHSGDSAPRFYSTRVIIDPTVSEIESFIADPPLQPNSVGFPGSVNVNLSNLQLRVPTMIAPLVGQTQVLENPTGHRVSMTSNGTVDFTSPTGDVARAMRTGGDQNITGDDYNGFLTDNDSPEVIGTQVLSISLSPIPSNPADPREFILTQVQFLATSCAQTPEVGDILAQSGFFAEVIENPAPQQAGLVTNLRVRLLLGDPDEWAISGTGPAQFLSPYDSVADAGNEGCFIRISPTPEGFPLDPTVGISTASVLGFQFSEGMNPASMTAFDSLTLTRVEAPEASGDYVVGRIEQSQNLQEFTFVPDLFLAHEGPPAPVAESYFLTMTTGSLGPTDLAGNSIDFPLPQIEVTVDPNAGSQVNGGRVTRFAAVDEEAPFGDDAMGPLPEWTGQHTYDTIRQLIKPRPVTRYEAIHDRTQAIPAIMAAAPLGVQTPLSNLGSKMQTVVRYADVGFGLTDPSNFNVDVEGLNWAPLGGQVVADVFTEFEISVAHAGFLPDEAKDPFCNSVFPGSGLTMNFGNNLLDPNNDPLRVVHPRQLGYVVSPGDLFSSSTGTLMMPYPLNRGIPQGQYRFYTWRDTAVLARGGLGGAGIEISNNVGLMGLPGPCYLDMMLMPQPYAPLQPAGDISTMGMPLLMEFKTFPDGGSLGLNSFDINIAPVGNTTPFFRAFSTGGTDTNNMVSTVDPDLEDQANGGFNPMSTPVPGVTTPGTDNTFHVGSIDLVVRVSRSYSVWFNTETVSGITSPTYNPAVMEPALVDQPAGTDVRLAYRGALNVTMNNAQLTGDASSFDPYGDFYTNPNGMPVCGAAGGVQADRSSPSSNPGIVPFNDLFWHTDISDIDTAPYYQARVTFVSNPESGLSPELSALAQTWTD